MQDGQGMEQAVLLMTRPRASAERFVAGLSERCRQMLRVVYAPLMEIVPTGGMPQIEAGEGAIFTSRQGVQLGPEGAGRPAYCVGRATAEAARGKGWQVQDRGEAAEDLVPKIAAGHGAAPLVHIAGRHRRGEIAERLIALGHQVRVCVAYDQRLLPLSAEGHAALCGKFPVLVPLFSPRSAAQFVKEAQDADVCDVLAMSEAVAAVLPAAWRARLRIIPAPSGKDMAQAVEIWCGKTTLP